MHSTSTNLKIAGDWLGVLPAKVGGVMKRFELRFVVWRPDGRLDVTYKEKSFFAGVSGDKTTTMTEGAFREMFPKADVSRPPKSRK